MEKASNEEAGPVNAASQRYVDTATERFRNALAAVVAEHERAGRVPLAVLGDPDVFAERAVRAASEWAFSQRASESR